MRNTFQCLFHNPPCTDHDECARRGPDPVAAQSRMKVRLTLICVLCVSLAGGLLWNFAEQPSRQHTLLSHAETFRRELKKSDVGDFVIIRTDPMYRSGTYKVTDAARGDLRLCGPIEAPLEKREFIRMCAMSDTLDASRGEHAEFVRTQDSTWSTLDREWNR